MTGSSVPDEHFCGCCGHEISATRPVDSDWCGLCESHLDPLTSMASWNRTYFAQFGKPCPYQVGSEA